MVEEDVGSVEVCLNTSAVGLLNPVPITLTYQDGSAQGTDTMQIIKGREGGREGEEVITLVFSIYMD